ncbi:ComEA family DNA-binding protein [Pseudomonas donghuensis]|uniref:ComEA family DNA-binding protein n=1 Tax=Pseudomonas donghuensis TaxID=1163398 RepID=UPI0020C2B756|nr:ComEA family DNA-binding protein [Pseudomonas donghuensis]MCP6699707.1 ComEA family DNA-binding protein [Pseudomonas donghuensis]
MRNTYLAPLLLAFFALFSVPALATDMAGDVPVPAVQATVTVVDLNSADAATLQSSLTGVGRLKAEAIVAYREQNGAYASVDALLEVKGIGKALLERNREKLSVK